MRRLRPHPVNRPLTDTTTGGPGQAGPQTPRQQEALRAAARCIVNSFDSAIIRRMAGYLRRLVVDLVTKPETRISESPRFTETRREQALGRNETAGRYPEDKCIHELFEKQAESSPDAVAIVHKDRELSYRELNDRSNQLAHCLRELGVGPETLVAVCLERSPELIVGLLGILKAGGAYVPLDPRYPSERLAFMLEDSQARVLVTNQSLHANCQNTSAKAVYLDADWREIEHQDTSTPGNVVSPRNLAYVIYTSGSTGKPKGVLIEHVGMVNLVYQYRELYGIRPGIRISQTASASFDGSGAEIWPTLLSGAVLCITPDEVRADPELLQHWLIDQRITIAYVTTVVAERLLAISWPKRSVPLRILLFGGERFRGRPPNKRYPFKLYNEYGPTEDTVWTTIAEVGEDSGTVASIGYPLLNHQVYVLNENQIPVPVGETGELCIGGIGLARGYLNRPELTAQKFIKSPLSAAPTDRVYRTGDLARYLPDGSLEYLGRIDNQVKIRGYRVEPGEIEVVLSRHPLVSGCTVIARENSLGDKQLVAYVVVHPEAGGGTSEGLAGRRNAGGQEAFPTKLNQSPARQLRSYLAGKLPDYMVPSAFVFLDQLPLTPNGKLDRRNLPEPGPSASQLVEPQTPLQRKLAKIWQNVLGVERVGLEDDFFELGGYSLQAARIASEVQKMLGKRIPIATLIQTPTVGKLAALLQAQDWRPSWSPLVAIQPYGTRTPFFAVHTITGDVLCYRGLGQNLGEDQPFFGLQSEGVNGGMIWHRSIPGMARYYVREIRRVQAHGPYYLGGYCIGGLVAFEMAQQLLAAGEEVACLALIDPDEPELRSTFDNRIQQALNESAALPPSEKLRYFKRRILGKVKWELGQLQEAAEDFIGWLYKKLKQQAGTTAFSVEPTIGAVGRTLLRAHWKYGPQPYPGRLTILRIPGSAGNPAADDRGWIKLAQGGVEIHDLPGEHLTIFKPEHQLVLAQKLNACIQAAASKCQHLSGSPSS